MTDINLAAIRARDTVTMETLPELERLAMTMEDEEMRAAILLVTDRRALLAYVDELLAERETRKGDASDRLHNLCAALEKDLDESPFTREEWSRMDAEIIECRNAYDELREAARKVTCAKFPPMESDTCDALADLRRLLGEVKS